MNIYQKPINTLMYLPLTASAAVKVGTALKMTSGGLAVCGAADKPEYLSNIEATGDGSPIPVSQITEETVLSAPLAAAYSSLAVGAKLKIATDGISVAASTGGALLVQGFEGKAAGDRVFFTAAEPDAASGT